MKKTIKKIVKWTAISFGGFIALCIVMAIVFGNSDEGKKQTAKVEAAQKTEKLAQEKAKTDKAQAEKQAEKKAAAAAQEKVDAEKKAKAEAAAQKTAELKVAADKKNAEKLAAQQKSQQDKAERKVNYQAAIDQLVDLGNGVIVSVEPVGTNYNYQKMIVSDAWYNSPTYEKQRFADMVHQKIMVNARMYKMVSKDDEVFLDIYDTYGKKVASYSMWSGMKIKE